MPKKSLKPLTKKLVNFYIGDPETMEQFYSALGYTVAIREVIHNHCNTLRERLSREGVPANVGTAPTIDALIADVLAAGAGGSELDVGDGLDQ